jgi:peptide/nickel transport system substrate-binding protein
MLTGMNVRISGFASILLAVIFSGCGKNSKTAAPESSAINYPLPEPPLVADCVPGIPGGRLVLATFGDPKTFNPIMQNETSSVTVNRYLFESLLNFDGITGELEPGLVESWTNTPDGKTWTFKLRKNLRWSDGEPLTADDVTFTWDVIYNPEIVNTLSALFIVSGKKFVVTKMDDVTVQVVTPEIYAPFLENFCNMPILPKHILAKTVINNTFTSAYGVNWKPEDIIGSGPFRLKEYKQGQFVLLERNPYFLEVDKKGERLPYFDNIILTVVPDENAISLRFLSGESDVDDSVLPNEYDNFKTESAKGKFNLLGLVASSDISVLWFNEDTDVNPQTGQHYVDAKKLKWFRNVKFRQACSYAIGRDSIINSIYSGHAIPSYGFVTPGNKKWFNPNTPQYPHDVAKALSLLKEIGIEKRNGDDFATDADGNKIEFVLNTESGGLFYKIALLIQSDLKQLGFNIILQPIELNSLVGKIADSYDYDCILLHHGSGTDPSWGMDMIKSSGFSHAWFPHEKTPSTDWEARMDDLMDAQMKTLDFSERKKDYDEVQEILGEQVPMIYTVTPLVSAAIRSNIGNVRPAPLSGYNTTWNVEELYFKK